MFIINKKNEIQLMHGDKTWVISIYRAITNYAHVL